MQLLESTRSFDDFRESDWDALGRSLLKYKGGLGDLGGGNHFLDAIVSYKTGRLFFLVHTGSRLESGLLDDFVDQPATFDREYKRITGWARDNRDTIADVIRKHFGLCNLVLDLPHNTFEIEDDGAVTIRKGAVKTDPGVLSILPSSMTGDVALVRASEQVASSLHSVSHGTGRTMSRGDARNRISPTETAEIRNQVYIPEYIVDASLRTESTRCYRALDDCLDLLGPLVNVEERFGVIAYLGHLG
jgi:tRNA-splicing ligase RtcB